MYLCAYLYLVCNFTHVKIHNCVCDNDDTDLFIVTVATKATNYCIKLSHCSSLLYLNF